MDVTLNSASLLFTPYNVKKTPPPFFWPLMFTSVKPFWHSGRVFKMNFINKFSNVVQQGPVHERGMTSKQNCPPTLSTLDQTKSYGDQVHGWPAGQAPSGKTEYVVEKNRLTSSITISRDVFIIVITK